MSKLTILTVPRHTANNWPAASFAARVRKSKSVWTPGFGASTIQVERHPGAIAVTFRDDEEHSASFHLTPDMAVTLMGALADAVHQDG